MPAKVSRANLLRGLLDTAQHHLRAPWSKPEADFTEVCDRTGACVKACPQKILTTGRGGFPEVDFTKGKGECTFCGDCVDVCRSGALVKAWKDSGKAPWNAKAYIGENCLSIKGVTCRACGDHCDARALTFRLALHGVAHPEIDFETCTGCGACLSACPVKVVSIVERAPAQM